MKNIESGATKQSWTDGTARLLLRCAITASAVIAIGALPAAAQAPKTAPTWSDNYSNTVTATGVTKSYPNHDRNIPEAVIASRMKDKASAQEVWASQKGKVTSYEGSVASGRITVVVDFGHIKDTHVYVRDAKK